MMQRKYSPDMSFGRFRGSVMIQLLMLVAVVEMRSQALATTRQPQALVDTGQHLVAKDSSIAEVPTTRYSTTAKVHVISTNYYPRQAFGKTRHRVYGSGRFHRNIHTSKLERNKVTAPVLRSLSETVEDNLLMESQLRGTVMIIENKHKLNITVPPKSKEADTGKLEQNTTDNNNVTGEDSGSSYSTQPVTLIGTTSAFTPSTFVIKSNTSAQLHETNVTLENEPNIVTKGIKLETNATSPEENTQNKSEITEPQNLNTSASKTLTSKYDAIFTSLPFEAKSTVDTQHEKQTFTGQENWRKYTAIETRPVTKALAADITVVPEVVTTKNKSAPLDVPVTHITSSNENSLKNNSTIDPDKMKQKKEEISPSPSRTSSEAKRSKPNKNGFGTAEVVSSRRGGYLNHSAKSFDPVKAVDDEDVDYFVPITKNLDADIQNKMIEEAILSEEKITDEENVRLFRENFKNSEENYSKLAVKPIVHKNTTFYTVNPNYKPLKKLEVQPPKPYVRDPDDNSWRNESISSLGIVFKPKNSSKPLTQVLKDKTESEITNLMEKKENTTELPELRERLEKLTEMRKNKKKKTLSSEELNDTDYKDFNPAWFLKDQHGTTSTTTSTTTSKPLIDGYIYSKTEDKLSPQKSEEIKVLENYKKPVTTFKPPENKKNKGHGPMDYYDNLYDHDDFTLQDIDLKRYPVTKPSVSRQEKTAPRTTQQPPMTKYKYSARERQPHTGERQPTLQYFPPRMLEYNKIKENELYPKYMDQFLFGPEKETVFPPYANAPPEITTVRPTTRAPINRNLHNTKSNPHHHHVNQKVNVFEQAGRQFDEYHQRFSVHPDTTVIEDGRVTLKPGEAEEYEEQFQKGGVLDKFLQNFQENSQRFKVDYPIVYNHSVVHKADEEGNRVVSSVAFMRQLFDDDISVEPPSTRRHRHQKHFLEQTKAYDPDHEKAGELSHDYELHFYMPDAEQRESITMPYMNDNM